MKLSFRSLRVSLKQRTLLLFELYSGTGPFIKTSKIKEIK